MIKSILYTIKRGVNMGLIKDKDKEMLKKTFKESMKDNVIIYVVTKKKKGAEDNNNYSPEVKEICLEVASIYPEKISVIEYDFDDDNDKVKELNLDKAPAIKLASSNKKYGVHFYGLPSGYEFMSLIEGIINISKGSTDLTEKTKKILSKITSPVHIQVFVTPTCPYCPLAVKLSHKLAIESENIKAEMIEVIEFPELGEKYLVEGVPKVVINDKVEMEGAYPEEHFIEHLLQAV